ncbi:[acyl-carrier-protein] S-malonyltransferase [Thermosyntropha lipolytica DSM 11003]|uniref:Malonyl CoA-acyl carrier protein transacylase n=1 Tax=Thermosyntropha lipolytica DSM 11003 TaxID=1123382 RepID=A0A1M5JDX6_9FIRM|nr:ACP S-malonyltransferase [Thermosyntropha lipolytica]SHG38565.1 [acyl-carrier-protein] S-malonyltransferase [Thermosyntropha lipolytica DSM 11003]
MRLGFVFPGQGSQYKGMGKEIACAFPEAREVFARADEVLGYKLSTLCFEGEQEKLDSTVYAQPAILATSLAILRVVRKQGLTASVYAGLSLGEYTALTAAGCIDLEEVLPLVVRRAEIMQDAVPTGEGKMAAVLGMETERIEAILKTVEGIVDIANYNCPGQVVISGETRAVEEAVCKINTEGGKARLLAVSIPSHSRLMEKAAQEFRFYLDKVDFRPGRGKVISNVNARENNYTDLRDILVKQLYSPVRWEESVRYMLSEVDYLVEIGPGNVLSGLIKRIDKRRLLGNVQDIKSLEALLKEVEKVGT